MNYSKEDVEAFKELIAGVNEEAKKVAQFLVDSGVATWKKESLSEQMQGELEPLPTSKKWDGDDIGEVLKHGRE